MREAIYLRDDTVFLLNFVDLYFPENVVHGANCFVVRGEIGKLREDVVKSVD